MSPAPLTYNWDGEAMRPLPYFAKNADKQFVVGLTYRLEVVEQRSSESHRHFFACVNEAFQNLPESQRGRWRSPEHLRKWALCQTGFCNETTFVTASKAEALRFAAFLTQLDEYAVVDVKGNMVAHFVAKSQSTREMARKDFQESKDAVLDVLAKLIGVETDTLKTNAGRAA